jgi:hypothetical protein
MYQLKKYIQPNTRDMALANASNSLSVILVRVAQIALVRENDAGV